MKTITIYRHSLFLWALLLTAFVSAQDRYKESFNASKDMTVSVNTSYANVIFETWNKDKVEVEAFVDGEGLSKEEKAEIFKNWKLDVLGNSKKVVITSNASHFGEGMAAFGGMEALKSLESLKSLKALNRLGDEAFWVEMPNFDFDFNFKVPKVPEFKEIPEWPFSKNRPSIKHKEGFLNFHIDNGSHFFDQEAYQKDKSAYVAKLNKKYGTNVKVKEVDQWLADVERWTADFEKVMERWGEDFGMKFSEKFGPDFEVKMEKWGEEFGKKMEVWGDEFGEKFAKDMEKWGEEFGKGMEEWAKQFEENEDNFSKEVITDEHGNKKIILQSKKDVHFSGKANKTIIVRMPKGTKTEVNVKYGELKMANAYNVKATLNYATLTANSIDGGSTLINASYAPVYVNTWNEGSLKVNYVEDCRLNTVASINLQANSSDVTINELLQNAMLSGSFGNLFVSEISPDFQSVDIVLENTDAAISLPKTAFGFYFNGKKSQLKAPKSLQLTETKSFDRKLLKGYHQSSSSKKNITINANYSNVSFQ